MKRASGLAPLALIACLAQPGPPTAQVSAPSQGRPGVGTDEAESATCLSCHPAIEPAWSHPSSHRLLLGCPTCHVELGTTGPGHAVRPPCADCHSELGHPDGAPCTTCHDPHGSPNVALVSRALRALDGLVFPVRYDETKGVSPGGLTHASTAGPGICEACHTRTTVFRRDTPGLEHDPGFCSLCHDHGAAFRAAR